MGFLHKKRRVVFSVFATFFVFFSFFATTIPLPVHAEETTNNPSPSILLPSSPSDVLNGIVNPAGFVLGKGAEALGNAAVGNAFAGWGCTDFGSCTSRFILQIGIWTVQFSLFILGIVGVLLDLALLITFNMGAIINPSSSVGQAVAQGWTIVRDLANLMFIAGFVWVSIDMILQTSSVPGSNRGKFIANVIIAALLVNFSYFFAGVIIDASNTISRLTYQTGVLNGQSIPVTNNFGEMISFVVDGKSPLTVTKDTNGADATTTPNANLGFISGAFLHQTKLTSILSPEALASKANDPDRSTITLGFLMYLGVTLIGLTIELFASMFFVILTRFGTLVVLLILSPLLVFRFMGIKPFSEWGDHWWNELKNQVIFLPVFMIMTAISFRVIGGFFKTLGGSDVSFASVLLDPSTQKFQAVFGLLILFGISYYLLKSSKTVAQNLSQGVKVDLPSAAKFQQQAAKLGNRFGESGAAVGRLPRTLWRSTLGFGLRNAGRGLEGVANRTGVPDRTRDIIDSVKDSGRKLGAGVGIGNKYELAREERLKSRFTGSGTGDERKKSKLEDAIADMKKAKDEVTEWEGRYRNATTNEEKVYAQDGLARARAAQAQAKADRKSAVNGMFDTLGAESAARHFDALSEEERNDAIDALDPDKAKQVTDLWRRGSGKATSKEREFARNIAAAGTAPAAGGGTPGITPTPAGGAGGAGTPPGAGGGPATPPPGRGGTPPLAGSTPTPAGGAEGLERATAVTDSTPEPEITLPEAVTRLEAVGGADERKELLRTNRELSRALSETEESIEALRRALGEGALGHLNAEALINSETALQQFNARDYENLVAHYGGDISHREVRNISRALREAGNPVVEEHESSPSGLADAAGVASDEPE